MVTQLRRYILPAEQGSLPGGRLGQPGDVQVRIKSQQCGALALQRNGRRDHLLPTQQVSQVGHLSPDEGVASGIILTQANSIQKKEEYFAH